MANEFKVKNGLIVGGDSTFSGNITIPQTAATTDTDKFAVLDNGIIKFRTGAQVLSDIGAQVTGSYDNYVSWTLQAQNQGGASLGTSTITSSDTAIFKAGTNVTLAWADDSITINSTDQFTGTVTGTGENNRLAIWNGNAAIDSDSDFYVDGDTIFTTNLEASGLVSALGGNSTQWNTAYTDRLKWDGGATGLVAATGRTSLGGTTIGSNMFTLTNPSAITFPRFNANNTVSALNAADFRTAIGAGTSSSNFYLDGITKSGNTLTFSVSGTTNQDYIFGSNAFTSTAIPAAANNPTITIGGGDGIIDSPGAFTLNQTNSETITIDVDSTVVRTTGTQSIAGLKTFTNNVEIANTAGLIFKDVAGIFPTSGKGFDWVLNDDGARIYAVQPSSDSIDFVFQLRDNAATNDRFVFHVQEWQGVSYDKYPLIMSGGTIANFKDSSIQTNGTTRLSNAGVLSNVTNTNWDTAYGNSVTAISDSGTSTTTITLTQQGGGTLSTSFSNPQGTVTGGPYLPLSAGSGEALTGALHIETSGGSMLNLKDTNSAGDASTPYISFYDNLNVRQGYIGMGSGGSAKLYLEGLDGIHTNNPLTVSGLITSTGGNSTEWNTAYTDRLKWDGGVTGLVAATGRASLGGTTIGSNMFTLINPSAITFPRFNANNTVSALNAADFRTAIGAGTSSSSGVTSVIAGTGLTGGGTSGAVTLNVAASTYTPFNDIRSLGTNAFTNGANSVITTAQVMAEIEADGGFDSYSSVFKTSWSYAGNYNLTDAGYFTETAGSSWLTWTDNSSDSTRGNITTLAIAPNTGGSAGGVFIYNDQGAGYSPGWRQVWTSTTDGAGSGLDADKLDGLEGSAYYLDSNPDSFTSNVGTVTGTGTTNYLPKFTGTTALGNSLVYDNGTNVGIGTTSPFGKLDVAGNIRLQSANRIYFGGTGSIPYWNVGVQNTTTNNFEIGGQSYYSGVRHILLNPVNNGKVGIGTTSPNAKLEIKGTGTGDNTPQLIIESGGTDNNSIIHFTDDGGGQVNAIGALEGNMLTFAGSTSLIFKTNTGSILGNTNTRLTINSSGAVFTLPVAGSSFVKTGGTSTQFLKADGSTDARTFLVNESVLYHEHIALSNETTDLTTGTSKVTFRAPRSILVTGFRISCNTAPTGSTIIVDVNKGGVSMLSTKLSIDVSEKTSVTASSQSVLITASAANAVDDDVEITIDIDQVGSTIAGKGLKLIMYYTLDPLL